MICIQQEHTMRNNLASVRVCRETAELITKTVQRKIRTMTH